MSSSPNTISRSQAVPKSLSIRISRIADLNGCSYEDALQDVISKGLREIDRKLAEFSGSEEFDELSQRQRDVLDGLRKGMAVKELADRLGVTEPTVRTHIYRLRQRLGCSDLLELRIPGR